jgi:hypothetical protein
VCTARERRCSLLNPPIPDEAFLCPRHLERACESRDPPLEVWCGTHSPGSCRRPCRSHHAPVATEIGELKTQRRKGAKRALPLREANRAEESSFAGRSGRNPHTMNASAHRVWIPILMRPSEGLIPPLSVEILDVAGPGSRERSEDLVELADSPPETWTRSCSAQRTDVTPGARWS